MTDNSDTQTEEAPARRGRPPKVRQRRNYVKELGELEARVQAAIRLLRRASGPGTVEPMLVKEIALIAIETLTGEGE